MDQTIGFIAGGQIAFILLLGLKQVRKDLSHIIFLVSMDSACAAF